MAPSNTRRRKSFRERYGTFAQVFLSWGIAFLFLGGIFMFLDSTLGIAFLSGGAILSLAVIAAISIINSADKAEEFRRGL